MKATANFVLQHLLCKSCRIPDAKQYLWIIYWSAERWLYAYQGTEECDIGPPVRSISHTELECWCAIFAGDQQFCRSHILYVSTTCIVHFYLIITSVLMHGQSCVYTCFTAYWLILCICQWIFPTSLLLFSPKSK